jgi:predicted dehydrogenase
MALDVAECDAMVEACERSGTRLAINHQAHCAPVTRRARQMLEEGEIGELLVMRALNKGNRKAGNELLEIGTHTFDRMLCFGGTATWAFGYLTCEGRDAGAQDVMLAQEMNPRDQDDGLVLGERGFAAFGFSGVGGIGRPIVGESYFFSYGPGESPGISGVELIGTKGQLAMRGTSSDRKLFHLPRAVSCAPEGASDWREITLPPMQEAPHFAGDRPALDDGITLMYSELLHAMKQGTEPPSNGVSGRAAVEMCMAVYESHRRRARVDLPLAEREHPLARWRRGE